VRKARGTSQKTYKAHLGGVKFHIAAYVSYWEKGPLIFYNDEGDPPKVKVSRPVEPRQIIYEDNTHFQQRIEE